MSLQDFYDVNSQVTEETIKKWNVLFKLNREKLTTKSTPIIQNRENPQIFISFTTCKRLNLFRETINSILNHWEDLDKIDYWFCVDDNSSIDDRVVMFNDYPWFDFVFKTSTEKGHRETMNIIWDKLNQLKPKYWIHMEDDFLFYDKMNYVGESIRLFEECEKNGFSEIKQILFNRNYGETIECLRIKGDILLPFTDKLVLHNHCQGLFSYTNCHYWPHYSFRPSMILTETILELGNYNSPNTFFEIDYARRWNVSGYKSAFFNKLTSRHIGKLTSERGINAYSLNGVNQHDIKQNTNLPKIKILNLKHRRDRQEQTKKMLDKNNVKNYEFVEAINGRELNLTDEIKNLFKGNDFGNRKGVIGCALSHYLLWRKLLEDGENSYYIIMEDDILETCEDLAIKLRAEEYINKDVVFLGYHMFSKNREEAKIYNTKNNMTIHPLNKNLFIGGTFGYSINKMGAYKLVEYINKNGIKHGIDYLMKIVPELDSYEVRPQLVFSDWDENGKMVDTDIQRDYESFDFSPKLNKLNTRFNNFGIFNNNIDASQLKLSNTSKKKYTRVKMLCNWCFSEQLCKEWSNMCEHGFIWKNIEITWEDDVDFYVIINMPPPGSKYDPSRTIVFQMEPWVADENKKWGVKTWGEWSNPVNFLKVFGRKTGDVNNIFWQLELPLPRLYETFEKSHTLSSICSSKYFDEGHIHRIDFLHYLEENVSIDIYSQNNQYGFKNYRGSLTPYVDKSKGIAPYKYYFMVEDSYENDFITEKMWEPILCETLVFYYGCPNVEQHVDPLAFVLLDMNDFEKSVKIIKQAISEDWWSQRIDAIRREKQRLLNEMAFFPRLKSVI